MDFGADASFKDAKKKIKEHYAIDVPESSIQAITEKHAENMVSMDFKENTIHSIVLDYLLAETDGSMIPIVETKIEETLENNSKEKVDRRKHRKLFWKEVRLSFSRRSGSVTKIFSAVLGSVNETGDALYESACRLGFDKTTKVHGIGDGATWIVRQFDRVFGDQAEYLVDFYHVSEYISKAAVYFDKKCPTDWKTKQEERLKKNKVSEVLEELNKKIELENLTESDHPVVACHRYLNNRKTHCNYADAIEKGLPIGSGEVESSHRGVIQKRLKIPGAWWKEGNARSMLALRVVRANEDWEFYWKKLELKVANECNEIYLNDMLEAA